MGAMGETIRIGALELRFLKTKEETAGSLDMFEMTVPPDARVPVPHYHRDWDETVYGLSGRLVFTVDGQPLEIGPGGHLFIPRGVVHGFVNRGPEPAVCLSVLTPGVLGPDYFREIGALLASGPPDPAAVREIMERHGLVPVAAE
jgi:quercetin dioxygenase-like cupin family protein